MKNTIPPPLKYRLFVLLGYSFLFTAFFSYKYNPLFSNYLTKVKGKDTARTATETMLSIIEVNGASEAVSGAFIDVEAGGQFIIKGGKDKIEGDPDKTAIPLKDPRVIKAGFTLTTGAGKRQKSLSFIYAEGISSGTGTGAAPNKGQDTGVEFVCYLLFLI